jgi:catechol 2,3-dioxygenase-like lactoylglutathione lyase family enzyme
MASIEFDHVGVVVHDLEVTAQFFVDLGFHREGPIEVSGTWVDRIVGLEGVRAELIMVTAPDGSGKLELTAFHHPTRAQDQTELPANAHCYRLIAYRVTDIEAVVAQAVRPDTTQSAMWWTMRTSTDSLTSADPKG